MTEQAEGLIGNAIIIPKSNIFLHNQRLGLFQVNEKAFRPFLYQLMMTSPIREKFSKSAAGTKVRHTSPQLIERIKFNLPTLPEQTKIADFLSDVDEKLQALKQKKTALETYKKGLMQKLFSQALRFKDADGKDFPDWEEKELGDFHEIKMGQSPSSHSYNIESNGVPLIQGNADIRNRLTEPRNFTSEITKVCFPGDLILTVRAPVGAIAKSNHYACIGRGVCAISSKNNCCIEFTYQFLLSYEPKWGNLEQGSTFTAVNSNDIRSLKIPFPSLAEQTKIADLLSSLDEKIAGTALASEKLEVWKKGLLQKVFV